MLPLPDDVIEHMLVHAEPRLLLEIGCKHIIRDSQHFRLEEGAYAPYMDGESRSPALKVLVFGNRSVLVLPHLRVGETGLDYVSQLQRSFDARFQCLRGFADLAGIACQFLC